MPFLSLFLTSMIFVKNLYEQVKKFEILKLNFELESLAGTAVHGAVCSELFGRCLTMESKVTKIKTHPRNFCSKKKS